MPSPFRQLGFTFTELLVAVTILGVITTFTLPKVMIQQNNNKQNAIAKEAAGTISQAYQAYQQANPSISPTTINTTRVAQYFSYVSQDTSSPMDSNEGSGNYACSAGEPCYRLHNGAVLHALFTSFCDTTSTSYIAFLMDPDGVYGGTTTGSSKSVRFNLYYNGRITEASNQKAGDNACSNGGTTPNGWGADSRSTWFSW